MKKVLASALMACAMAWAGGQSNGFLEKEAEKMKKEYSKGELYCASFKMQSYQEIMIGACSTYSDKKRQEKCFADTIDNEKHVLNVLKDYLQNCRKELK